MNSFYYNIGGRIRALRELNRYTREKFAEIADISPKFLYEIETGQKDFQRILCIGLPKAYPYPMNTSCRGSPRNQPTVKSSKV